MKKIIIYIFLFSSLTLFGCGRTIETGAPDPENAVYIIEGTSYKLINGKFEKQMPTRPISNVTSIFESKTRTDINSDGREDAVVVLTQNLGGSGTFFYAAVAINTPAGYVGSNAVFLGDRIAPQNTRFENGIIEVNYAERKPGDNFTVRPSVGVTKYLLYKDGGLKEILK